MKLSDIKDQMDRENFDAHFEDCGAWITPIILFILFSTVAAILFSAVGHSTQLHPRGTVYSICRQLIIYDTPMAYRLDPLTNNKTLIMDGVYHTDAPWCLYVIKNGFPREINQGDEDRKSVV